PAAVVDDLEAIEIQVAQHVVRAVRVRHLERLLEAALEFAPVHQAGESVMARLVRHLAGDAAQLTDIAHDDDSAHDFALLALQRGDGELDRALIAPAARDHDATATGRDLRLCCQTMAYRIAEGSAVALVEQRDDVGDALAESIDRADADELLAGLIHVVDTTVDVGRDDPFAERIERLPRG